MTPADGLSLPPACVPDEDGRCSVCGDEGLVGEVLELGEDGMGRVRLERPGREADPDAPGEAVALDLLEEVAPGDRVVVHMGFAIARIREEGP